MVNKPREAGVRNVDIGDDRAGQRLDNFLTSQLPGVPRGALYRFIRTGQVRVNGKRCKPMQKLEAGDRVRIPPARIDNASPARVPDPVISELMSRLIWESDDLMAVDKPSGIAVHAGSGVAWGVIDAIRQARPKLEPDLVHRLDRETSGLLLLGKHPGATRWLQEQFRQRETAKRYFALLDGRLQEDRVLVDQPLAKTVRGGERFMVAGEDGKDALTEFRRLENRGAATFVEALPVTGRTHQIRAHAVWLDLPCAGDPRYQPEPRQALWRKRGLERLFLHAHALEFTAPDGERMHLSCPLPDDLSQVLDRLPT
jgi:23S rRNA pseudouridine955/2504/2580 synthase